MRGLYTRALAVLLLGSALMAAPAMAQGRKGGGMGMPRYDKATETTVTGSVEMLHEHQGRGGGTGLHLMVKAGTETLEVHVAPTRWLAEKQMAFAQGDMLTITGSKVTVDGKAAFLAREIKKGEQTYTLRNEQGIPAWSGRGGRTN